MADYEKLNRDDFALIEEMKTLELAPDSHTKDNRDKRKALQARRDQLAAAQTTLRENMQKGQQALQGLYQSVEASLQLAAHAEKWEWKEVEAEPVTSA